MPHTARSLYKRLLIIDDDLEDQEIFIEAVREVDRSIVCFPATSGDDALRKLENEMVLLPDLIFLDMNMPRLNGKQVLRELKSRAPWAHIPVIMYSTSFAPRDSEDLSKLGASHQLLKPARFEDLCRALGHVLSVDWMNGRPRA